MLGVRPAGYLRVRQTISNSSVSDFDLHPIGWESDDLGKPFILPVSKDHRATYRGAEPQFEQCW